MGSDDERAQFLTQVTKGCRIAKTLRELGVRPYGAVRIDSACGAGDWLEDPEANQQRIAETFRQACQIAEDHGEKLTAEGEICWGGMHSWKKMADLLSRVDRPQTLGFQADMAHTYLYLLGYNAPEDALLQEGYSDEELHEAYRQMTDVLRPWTNDFHVAQNDGTVFGSGSHDKTGRHCLATDPNGKLDMVAMAAYWLRESGPGSPPHRRFEHICWDGCMFPNDVMMQPKTWHDILSVMVAVRDEHGWQA